MSSGCLDPGAGSEAEKSLVQRLLSSTPLTSSCSHAPTWMFSHVSDTQGLCTCHGLFPEPSSLEIHVPASLGFLLHQCHLFCEDVLGHPL